MKNQIMPFFFQLSEDVKHEVRIVDQSGNYWFVAADVCAALGIDVTAVRKLDDDEKGLHSTQTLGGVQDVGIINESGLYTLILRCRDATTEGTVAHRFRKWVTSEVLPTIRKTGGYQQQRKPSNYLTAARTFMHYHKLAKQMGMQRKASALFADRAAHDATGISPLAVGGGVDLPDDPAPRQSTRPEMSLDTSVLNEAAACLNTILDAQIKVDGVNYRVRDLISQPMAGVESSAVKRALGMYGMRIDTDGHLLISNNNGLLARKILHGTEWTPNWNKLLAQLPDVDKINKVVRIGGVACRCVSVPIN